MGGVNCERVTGLSLTERDNYLRTVGFNGPEWIPCRIHISGASRVEYGQELHKIAQHYPRFFDERDQVKDSFIRPKFHPSHRSGEKFEDAWGCVWETAADGIEGVVTKHPLADWGSFGGYHVPDPLSVGDRGPVNWDDIAEHISEQKNAGKLTSGGLVHGFLLLRLTYLRGFENLVYDLVDEEPKLKPLIEGIYQHSKTIVDKFLAMDVDIIEFPEDLGTQASSFISPRMMDKYVIPVYKRLMDPCRQHRKHVAFHSDGYIMGVVDQLLDAGVTILNPQDLCNGIDALASQVKGRVAIRLDVDRQSIVPFGNHQDIMNLIEEEVRKLGSPEGGLEFIAGIYPPTPPENVMSLCKAFEKFERYYW